MEGSLSSKPVPCAIFCTSGLFSEVKSCPCLATLAMNSSLTTKHLLSPDRNEDCSSGCDVNRSWQTPTAAAEQCRQGTRMGNKNEVRRLQWKDKRIPSLQKTLPGPLPLVFKSLLMTRSKFSARSLNTSRLGRGLYDQQARLLTNKALETSSLPCASARRGAAKADWTVT